LDEIKLIFSINNIFNKSKEVYFYEDKNDENFNENRAMLKYDNKSLYNKFEFIQKKISE